jgi:hypothetical protein
VPITAHTRQSGRLVISNALECPAAIELLADIPGYPPMSVVKFSPNNLGGSNTITLQAISSPMNGAIAIALNSFVHAGGALDSSLFRSRGHRCATHSAQQRRLAFPFHGKYVDYDCCLIQMGARYYDAYSACSSNRTVGLCRQRNLYPRSAIIPQASRPHGLVLAALPLAR